MVRGHFDGLVVAQDRAVGQQNRHPQHLTGDKRHVRQRPGLAGRRGGREGGRRGVRGGEPGAAGRGAGRGGAGRAPRDLGNRGRRATCAGGAACGHHGWPGRGRRGVSSVVISVILCLRSPSLETRPGAPPRRSRSGGAGAPGARRAVGTVAGDDSGAGGRSETPPGRGEPRVDQGSSWGVSARVLVVVPVDK